MSSCAEPRPLVRLPVDAGLPRPDDDRYSAVGHRHRGYGPPGAAQRVGNVRTRGGGRRRRYDSSTRHTRPLVIKRHFTFQDDKQ